MGGGEGGDICRRRPCNCSSGWDGKTFGSRAPRNRTAWSNNSGGSLPRYSSFLEARINCDLHPSVAHEQGNEDMRGDGGHLSRGELSHQQTAAEEALGGFLKQIYHMGISLEGRDKFIHVEKGQVISSEGRTRYFPFTFHIW